MEAARGFMVKNDRYPPRGERIAAWVEQYMQRHGLNVGELAFKVGADKRDVRRLLNEKSCGPRLNDLLEWAFGHEFVDAVALATAGDRIASLEREIAHERARMAARESQLAREKALHHARAAATGGRLRLVPEEDRNWPA
jgi:hypothetical protein